MPKLNYPHRDMWLLKELQFLLRSGYSLQSAAAALSISYEKAKRMAAEFNIPVFTTGHAAVEAAIRAGVVPESCRSRPPGEVSHRPRNLGPQIARLVAERVRKRRESLGQTQDDVVRGAQLWRQSIQRIEAAEVCPTLPMLYYLARYLGCTIYDLLPPSLPDEWFEFPPERRDQHTRAKAKTKTS